MTDRPWDKPEPEGVVRLVDQYVSKMHADAERASNVELLDDSQVYELHLLAADIYGCGYADGRRSADARHDGVMQRLFGKGKANRASMEDGA